MKTIRILFIAAGLAGFAGSSVAQIHPRLDNNWTITPGGASNIAVALESIHAGGGGASFTNLSAGTPLYISVTNSNGGTNGLISITADNLNAIKGWLLTNDIITLTFVTGAFQQTTNDFNSIFGKLASPNSWLAPQTFTSVVMQTTYQQVTQIVTVTNGVSPIYITVDLYMSIDKPERLP